jgi:hypothetical protein
MKTIKPVNIGGMAGGDKYLAQNILFKLSIDAFNLFGGSDEAAGKLASLEIKGLASLCSYTFDSGQTDLHFPLVRYNRFEI